MNRFTIKNVNGEYALVKGIPGEHALHRLGQYEDIGLEPQEVEGFTSFATLAKTLNLANEMDILQILKMGLSKRACLNCVYFNQNKICENPLVVIEHNEEKGCWKFKKRQIEDLF